MAQGDAKAEKKEVEKNAKDEKKKKEDKKKEEEMVRAVILF
jgi:ribosomal protein S25